MRWQKEARIRIHGDRAEGEKYVSLARTLLGGLFERNHQIMEGGIAPRFSDSQISNANREPIAQSVANTSVPGADIRVEYNSWMPVIDIWVGGKKEDGKRDPKFGVMGKNRVEGDEAFREYASIEYTEAYFNVPLVSGRHAMYIGRNKGLTWGYSVTPTAPIAGIYPHPTDAGQPDIFYQWTAFNLDAFVYTFTPFTDTQNFRFQITSDAHTFSDSIAFTGFESLLANARVTPLRVMGNGNTEVLVGVTVKLSGLNVDTGNVLQPVPIGVRMELETGAVLSEWVYPTTSLTMFPAPGKCYLTPSSVGVGEDTFYTLCMSFDGYSSALDAFSEAAVGWEAQIFYTQNNGNTFTRRSIRSHIEPYIDVSIPHRVPGLRFSNHLNWHLQYTNATAKWLPIGNSETLLYLLVSEQAIPDNPNQDIITSLILRITPTTITTVWATTGLSQLDYIQSWVYLGAGVVLAKFVDGLPMSDHQVTYRVSYNFGATWDTVAALGLPGNRMNQYYGGFCLVTPYVSAEQGGLVLTSVYHDNAYRSYASTDAGQTWSETGKLSDTEEFYRVDWMRTESFWQSGALFQPLDGGHFEYIRYYGTREEPAPFNPALPELMRVPTP